VGGPSVRAGDAHAARLELLGQRRDLVLVEVEHARKRIQSGRVHDPLVLGVREKLDDFVVLENGADLFLLLAQATAARARRRSKRSIRLPRTTSRATPVYAG
jgi:hypothetical protein